MQWLTELPSILGLLLIMADIAVLMFVLVVIRGATIQDMRKCIVQSAQRVLRFLRSKE